jgi:hypothetical protein
MKSLVPSGHFGNSSDNIYHVKNFVKKNHINLIYEYSKNIKSFNGPQDSDIWKDRVCYGNQIEKENKEVFDITNLYLKKSKIFIENAFSLSLKPAYSSIVVWNVGDNQPPHADKENPDGSCNGTPFYDISSLIYINDNFDGGSIYFPNQNLEIQPSPGDFVCFPGDKEYVHGVKEITNGKRFTIPMFFTVENKKNNSY